MQLCIYSCINTHIHNINIHTCRHTSEDIFMYSHVYNVYKFKVVNTYLHTHIYDLTGNQNIYIYIYKENFPRPWYLYYL